VILHIGRTTTKQNNIFFLGEDRIGRGEDTKMTKEGETTTNNNASEKQPETSAVVDPQQEQQNGAQQQQPQDLQVSIKVKIFGKEEPIPLTINKMDTVQDLKQFLFEIKEICHITSYNFSLNGKKVRFLLPSGCVSPRVESL